MLAKTALLIVLSTLSQSAEVSSAIEAPNIQELPDMWLSWMDNNLAAGDQDNNRAFSFNLGIKLPYNLIFSINDSALTEDYTTLTRIDEVSFSMGYLWQPTSDFYLIPSIGSRLRGNYSNQSIQQNWDARWGFRSIQVNYQEAPTVYTAGLVAEYTKEFASTSYNDTTSAHYGISLRGVGSITTEGEQESALQAILYANHHLIKSSHDSIYVGVRQEFHSGNSGSITAYQVQGVEKGIYGLIGFMLDDLIYYESGYSKSYCYGEVGFIFNW